MRIHRRKEIHMLELHIQVDIPAIDRLAAALVGKQAEAAAAHTAPAPTHPAAPPVPPPAPAVPLAPTAAPSITLEQIARAGADLLTANPTIMPQLNALLQRYGVQSAQQLRPDQLGGFATDLRGLGAKI